jgi:hypothetical protein
MRYEEMKETQAKFESSVGSYIKAHPRESYREVGKAVGISITDLERIKVWVDAGKQVVMVAKFGKCAVLDFDNFEACKELGFDEQCLQGMLRVDTPSGPGYFHCYLPWRPALDAFDASGNLIGELKLNNSTVAAPGSLRFNSECPGKVEGAYVSVTEQKAEPCPDAPAVAAWFRTRGNAGNAKVEFVGKKERTRLRRISLSNSAKTASKPATAGAAVLLLPPWLDYDPPVLHTTSIRIASLTRSRTGKGRLGVYGVESQVSSQMSRFSGFLSLRPWKKTRHRVT